MSKEIDVDLVTKLTFQNALKYNGKPAAKTIIGAILGKYPEYRLQAKIVKQIVEEKVNEISLLSLEAIKKKIEDSYPELLEIKYEKKKEEKSLPKLNNAVKGNVKLRLPPEPSGYLHIGHAYAGFINQIYKEEYDGHVTLRFEDTNPKKVEPEFYDVIKEAYDYLGIKYDKIIYKSDNLGIYQKNGLKLIENGNAYVCFCEVEQTRENRQQGVACTHRDHSSDKNLEFWERMNNEYEEGKAVLRLKADMTTTKESLRDPTIMRILDYPHPRIGNDFRVYPLYDFAVSIEDSIMTHVLRSEEFIPKMDLQNLIRSYLSLPNPEYKHFSRLRIKNTPVRKRVIRKLIEEKVIQNWHDPRLSTVFGLRNRGIVPETMRDLAYTLRLSSSQSEIEWSTILAINRKILDPKIRRFFAVIEPFTLKLENTEIFKVEINNHPQNKDLGSRTIKISDEFLIDIEDITDIKNSSVIRLKDFSNVDILEVDEKNSLIIGQISSDKSRNIPKVQWVPKKDSLGLELRKINDLYTSAEEEILNPESMIVQHGYIETNIRDLKVHNVLQLERKGIASIEAIKNNKYILNLTQSS